MRKMILAGICASMIVPTSAFAEADCAERFGYEFGGELSYNVNCFFGCKFYNACRQCIYTDKQTGLTQVRPNCPQNVTEDDKEVVAETEAESEDPPPTPKSKSKKVKAKTVVEEEEVEVDEQVAEEVKVESSKRVTMNPKKSKPIPDIELPPDLPPAQTEEEIKQQVEDAVEQELESVEPPPPPPPPTPKSPPPEPKVIMAEVEQEPEQESSHGLWSQVANLFSSDGEKTDVSWKRTFNDDKDALIVKVRAECEKNGVNPNFCEALGWTESKFELGLVSNKNARGILQMIPETARAYGCEPEQIQDADVIIPCAVRLIVDLQKKYKGDFSLMASAYNAGEPRTDNGRAKTFPETINYVARVNAIMSILEGRPVCDSHDCIIFKPNAQADGPTDPLLLDLMVELQNEVPAFLWVSGCNDDYTRKGIKTLHDEGKACDIGLYDQRYEKVAYAKVDEVIANMGLSNQLVVKKNPGGRATTAPHVHIELKQSQATTVMASANSDKKPMFVMGDSLAVGLCLAWDTKANCKAKTGAFLRKIPVEAIPTNLPADTTLVFWAGTNDAVADWGAFDMLQHINGIMSQLSKHNGKVVWMKIPNARPNMQARVDQLNMMIETANENFPKVKVLDVPAEKKGKDMVHFTPEGYNTISQHIEKET